MGNSHPGQGIKEGITTKRLCTQVAVVGGGSGGFAAAYTLAKRGVRTILIEKNPGLGGTSVYGGVNCWEPGVASGEIHRILRDKLMEIPDACAVCKSVSAAGYPWGLSVPAPEATYEDTLKRCPALVTIPELKRFQFEPEAMNSVMQGLLAEYPDTVSVMLETEYCSCTTEDGKVRSVVVRNATDEYEIFADYFVDSTGDIYLARDAGCEAVIGRESAEAYHEPSARERDASAINGVTYVFRIRKTDDPTHVDPYVEDENALPPRSHVATCFNVYPNGEINMNMLPTLTGKEYLELGDRADMVGRATARRYWHYLQTHYGVTGYTLLYLFPMPGIREGYRLVGKYVLTEHDLLVDAAENRFGDQTATIADHARDRHEETGNCQDVPTPYAIPIDCARAKEFSNLYVACRGASFSSIAASSARLTRTMIGLGEAVGNNIAKKIQER